MTSEAEVKVIEAPAVRRSSAGEVEISVEECKGCGLCVIACPPGVLSLSEGFNGRGYHPAVWTGGGCTGCGACFYACPEPGAIRVRQERGGRP